MDDLGRGGDDGSLATGNAGARCLENTICDKKRQHLRQKYKKMRHKYSQGCLLENTN